MSHHLYLGTRRYSSWSLRGWLAVRLAGIAAEEVVIPLGANGTPALAGVSPSGLVPCLVVDGHRIWDSLAIAEYCAELCPALWPVERLARATARAVAAEMHSGFRELRIAMPMNLGKSARLDPVPGAVAANIARIEAVWRECVAGHGGPFLFGARASVADVMYAPVVARFISYQPALSAEALAYCATIRAMRKWTNGTGWPPPSRWPGASPNTRHDRRVARGRGGAAAARNLLAQRQRLRLAAGASAHAGAEPASPRRGGARLRRSVSRRAVRGRARKLAAGAARLSLRRRRRSRAARTEADRGA